MMFSINSIKTVVFFVGSIAARNLLRPKACIQHDLGCSVGVINGIWPEFNEAAAVYERQVT
jgi:hypothetical protein